MSEQINQVEVVDEIKSAFHQLQETNEKRFEQIEKNGKAQGELEEKADRIANEVTSLAEKVQKLNAVANQEVKQEVEYKSAEYNLAVKNYILKNDKSGLVTKALQNRISSDGGFLVNPELEAEIGKRFFETSPMRQVATVRTLNNSDRLEKLVRSSEVATGGWVGEMQTMSTTDTGKFDQITIDAHKHFAFPLVSEELLVDSSNVESLLLEEAQSSLSREENTAFIAGDGVKKPKGILEYAAGGSSYAFNKLEQVNSGEASAVTPEGLLALQTSLFEQYQGNASFMMTRKTFGEILKIKSTDTYFFAGFQDARSSLNLLGKPVIFASDMTEIAANSLSIAYGDFRAGYTIVEKAGTSITKDIYTNPAAPRYIVRRRVGGAVTDFDAIKLQKIAS